MLNDRLKTLSKEEEILSFFNDAKIILGDDLLGDYKNRCKWFENQKLFFNFVGLVQWLGHESNILYHINLILEMEEEEQKTHIANLEAIFSIQNDEDFLAAFSKIIAKKDRIKTMQALLLYELFIWRR